MKTIKDSVNALAFLLLVAAAAAIIMPFASRGQGDSQNAPPLRTARLFYLTTTDHNGSEALTACATGFHMASLWEILDTSNLRYDTTRGLTHADSGLGPPFAVHGWIRTGNQVGDDGAGNANCLAYTTASELVFGTTVDLPRVWASPEVTLISPWEALAITCNQPKRVWCVQN